MAPLASTSPDGVRKDEPAVFLAVGLADDREPVPAGGLVDASSAPETVPLLEPPPAVSLSTEPRPSVVAPVPRSARVAAVSAVSTPKVAPKVVPKVLPKVVAVTTPRSADLPRATVTTTTRPTSTTAPKPTPSTPTTAAAPPVPTVWDRLAQCESGNRNDPGGPYYGYWQFSAGAWASVGEKGLPNQYGRAHQLAAAKRLQAARGWGAWATCAGQLGLIS